MALNVNKMESQNNVSAAEENEGTSFSRTCFNGLNTLTGVGILSIPYALSQGGWLSLIILLVIALLCYYTGLLLRRCMDSNPNIKTYPDIGEVAFGSTGRVLISTFMYLELYFVAVEFLILEGDNLRKLFPDLNFHVAGISISGKQGFVLLTALLVLPTTWLRSLGLLAYISAGGVLASFVLVCSVFWVGAFDGVGFDEKGSLWNSNDLATVVSLYTFCYCGYAVFPTLCNSMKNRAEFPKVLLVCFVLSTICYGSMAVLGYLMYDGNLMSQVTLNLPTKKLSTKVAIYTTLLNPITKYAIIVSPINTAIEATFPLLKRRSISLVIRTVIVCNTVLVALTVPFFGYVMAFIGAFTGTSVSMLFPSIFYLKINKQARKFGVELVIIILILVAGASVAVVADFVIAGVQAYYIDGSFPSNCTTKIPYNQSKMRDLISRMQKSWPSLSCPSNNGFSLWSREWKQHGTCSESVLDQHSYFQYALSLKDKVKLLQNLRNAGIKPDGKLYSIDGVMEAIRAEIGYYPGIKCNSDKSGQMQLHQIYICVDTSATRFIECPGLPNFRCTSNIKFATF